MVLFTKLPHRVLQVINFTDMSFLCPNSTYYSKYGGSGSLWYLYFLLGVSLPHYTARSWGLCAPKRGWSSLTCSPTLNSLLTVWSCGVHAVPTRLGRYVHILSRPLLTMNATQNSNRSAGKFLYLYIRYTSLGLTLLGFYGLFSLACLTFFQLNSHEGVSHVNANELVRILSENITRQ